MMQMIEAGGVPILADGVRCADEDNPRGYYELEAVKGIARDASFLAEAPGRAVKIVTPLLTSLPPEFAYRVILVERDLGEVMASQRAMMTRRGTGDGADDGAMRRAFESALVRAQAWLDGAEEVETLHVAHRALVTTPRDEARRIAAFVGVGVEDVERIEVMAAIVDTKLHRQRSD